MKERKNGGKEIGGRQAKKGGEQNQSNRDVNRICKEQEISSKIEDLQIHFYFIG